MKIARAVGVSTLIDTAATIVIDLNYNAVQVTPMARSAKTFKLVNKKLAGPVGAQVSEAAARKSVFKLVNKKL